MTPYKVGNIKLKKSVIQKINKEVEECTKKYKQTVLFLAGDVPIQTLCLHKTIENALVKGGYLRVYDLINTDLTKIKGLGKIRRQRLAACLDEFFSVF